jgi:hypothetical protein
VCVCVCVYVCDTTDLGVVIKRGDPRLSTHVRNGEREHISIKSDDTTETVTKNMDGWIRVWEGVWQGAGRGACVCVKRLGMACIHEACTARPAHGLSRLATALTLALVVHLLVLAVLLGTRLVPEQAAGGGTVCIMRITQASVGAVWGRRLCARVRAYG